MFLRIVNDWFGRSNKAERLWLLAKIEFKLRYYENKLGLLWALIKPLLDLAIFYLVFQVVLQQNIPSYASFLFIGLIIWNFFVESTTGTIQILNVKKYLYEYSNMNKLEIYVSTLFSNAIGFFFNFCIFLLFYHVFETGSIGFSVHNLWIILLFINLFILSLGVSIILSTIYIIAKDITQIWMPLTTFLFFLSPIFYRLSTFQEALPSLVYANPVAGIIINARRVLMEGKAPDFELMAFDFAYAIALLVAGMIFLNRLGAKAAEKL